MLRLRAGIGHEAARIYYISWQRRSGMAACGERAVQNLLRLAAIYDRKAEEFEIKE
jgi:hypothetical protein